MKLALVGVYAVSTWLFSLDLFASYDFVITIFFSASACILYALIAKHIDSLFADLFIILQACTLLNYAAMAVSYSLFDLSYMLYLENINTALLITDIIALIGVMFGDRWLYSRAS